MPEDVLTNNMAENTAAVNGSTITGPTTAIPYMSGTGTATPYINGTTTIPYSGVYLPNTITISGVPAVIEKTVSIPGKLQVLEKVNPYEFRVQIDIMRDGVNNNRWDYRNIDRYWRTFMGNPILIAYVNGKIGDGHNMREVIAPDGGREYTFVDGTAERIIGVLSDDEKDFSVTERDGHKWITAKGKIFTFYAREAVEKIIAAGAMDVSAETDVFSVKNGPDGIEIFEEWAGLGVTILGDDVPPAIPGARIKQLAQIREDMEGMRLKAASLIEAGGNEPEPETKREKGVESIMNKRELAQLQTKFEGYTVLGASDDGRNVCLMRNEDCAFCGYTFADDGVVVPERIKTMRAVTTFAFGDGEDERVAMDAGIPTDALSAKLIRANADIGEKDQKIAELEGEVKKMQENERIRRIEAAKAAVNAKFESMNAVREHCFDAELAAKVCEVCESGKFCADTDGEGKWCGDKNAVSMLLAACMEAQNEMDKQAASKRAKTFNAWNDSLDGDANKGVTGEDALMAWLEK